MLIKQLAAWHKKLVRILAFSISSLWIGSASFATTGIEGVRVDQNNMHLSPEHKQRLADAISRYHHADNLWDVLREEFSLAHYEDSPAVQDKIAWFMNNQDFLLHSASRAAPYLYYILQQVKKHHLPAEVVLLPIIESGYNPFNVSSMGAAGIWQLMPGTASGLGVKQDWWYDGRRDVIASTLAALNHLSYLQSFFNGEWMLVFAAYDTGEGNVMAAIRRNIRSGRGTDFWSLPLAQETRNYVPSLLALATIISHPEQYPVYLPPVRNAPYLAEVDLGTQINLQYAATLAGISYKQLFSLNPGFRQNAVGKGPSKLILPIENVEQFTENFARTPFNHSQDQWNHYRVKPGDTLFSVSKKFNTTTIALRKLNHLNNNNLRLGANLLVPTHESVSSFATYNSPSRLLNEAKKLDALLAYNQNRVKNKLQQVMPVSSMPAYIPANRFKYVYAMQPGDTVYMVRAHDTLNSIAKHFHLNPHSIQAANQLPNNAVHFGRQLIIPTHAMNQTAQVYPNLSIPHQIMPGDTVYMVRKGDTFEKIAQKFGTTSSMLRLANLAHDETLQEGDKLIIPARWQS